MSTERQYLAEIGKLLWDVRALLRKLVSPKKITRKKK